MSTENQTLEDVKITMPSVWVVKILNDNYTPVTFVIELLQIVFNKSEEDAEILTLKVHHEGEAIVGTYTKDVAVTKAQRAMAQAEACGHPLRVFPMQG